jgi:hypothetical protein
MSLKSSNTTDWMLELYNYAKVHWYTLASYLPSIVLPQNARNAWEVMNWWRGVGEDEEVKKLSADALASVQSEDIEDTQAQRYTWHWWRLRWEVQRKWKTNSRVFSEAIAYLVFICLTMQDMMWRCGQTFTEVVWWKMGRFQEEGRASYIGLEAALALPQ